MDRYTRRQLVLLLGVVLVAGAGLGIDRWRRTHAELTDRLETFDHAPAPAAEPRYAVPRPPAAPRPPRQLDAPATPLELNDASVDDLDRLPGVSHGLATRIVESRMRSGPFAAVDDLRRVRGIGRATLARLRHLVAVTRPP
ncbi:MAG TPA: helix-hairpin-helix domain-containing protein [Methylomirabilota bacterium]|nr:helix-hairpin-helix domain-containing protein [Methylomirabilota bacterium]